MLQGSNTGDHVCIKHNALSDPSQLMAMTISSVGRDIENTFQIGILLVDRKRQASTCTCNIQFGICLALDASIDTYVSMECFQFQICGYCG